MNKNIKSKSLHLVLVCLTLCFANISISQDYPGDFGIRNYTTTPITVKVFARSIPFDGLTLESSHNQYNRFDTLQNGSYCRRFLSNTNFDLFQLFYYYKALDGTANNNAFQLGLVGGNADNSFGHGIYEINIDVPSAQKKYKAYFNCLDNNYGSTINGLVYGNDFIFEYKGGQEDVLVTASPSGYSSTLRPFTEGQIITEYKVWEICPPYTQYQRGERFYARTTPFGVSPEVIYGSYARNFILRTFFIGTKVVFDRVYDNYGQYDRWGYNTVVDNFYGDYFRSR